MVSLVMLPLEEFESGGSPAINVEVVTEVCVTVTVSFGACAEVTTTTGSSDVCVERADAKLCCVWESLALSTTNSLRRYNTKIPITEYTSILSVFQNGLGEEDTGGGLKIMASFGSKNSSIE